MVRASKQAAGSFILDQRVKVKVTPARFKLFESTRQLDVARLKRAAQARFEVGYFETDCCRRVVHAVVKQGRVTKLELEPCKGEVRATPELGQVLRAARKRLGADRTGTKPLPMPVDKFLSQAARIVIHIWGCIQICIFGYCFLCCYDIGIGLPWGFCRWLPVATPSSP
jgi:hypothetical protein